MIVKKIIKVPSDTFEEQMRIFMKMQYRSEKSRDYNLPQFEHKPNPNRLPRDDY